jgi:hypothetical protein
VPQWIRDEADYAYRLPGETAETRVHVTGVMDTSEEARPKILLESRWDNQGPSVQEDPEALAACVRRLSESMGVAPQEVDWYTRDANDQLQWVGIDYESVSQTNPQYLALERSGDLNHRDLEDARKFFPDVTTQEMRATFENPTPSQANELTQAFREAEHAPTPDPETRQSPVSTHEYDLSQERF